MAHAGMSALARGFHRSLRHSGRLIEAQSELVEVYLRELR